MTFEHVLLPGAGTPLLLLHGTGGDEHDLLPLRDHLGWAGDGAGPVLSPRGQVSENGANRFFRRLAEGVLDEDDLRARVDELADFVLGVDAGPWVAAGFSNGANTASALLFRRPEVLSAAVLLAAMVPFRDGPGDVDLSGKRVAVSNGRRDPLVSTAETATLLAQLRGCGAEVEEFPHDGGHGIDASVLPEVKAFLER
ncbi:alpha/beta hydrolase [Pseudonocardia abyssalis]|uniref:Alpha/beta hydrolase n=1 Tax=Pseudonocardia abyssalis TaxID=2792008 RepID=A0ABS6UQN4_9PSEU|nr:alpha/beta hydrolase [Pseudonocardia abyssalis]MBW0117532.1 alpha/beta hydrolase [Pseudonocardia abyssalis]MBW0134573.1 alpha/beta hydrolase [Pseudonocardia abyssalis]